MRSPRSLCSLLAETFRLYSRHFLPLAILGALPWVVLDVGAGALQERIAGEQALHPVSLFGPVTLGLAAYGLVAGLLVYPLVSGALARAVVGSRLHRRVDLGQAVRAAWERAPALVGAYLRMGLALGGVAGLVGLGWYLLEHSWLHSGWKALGQVGLVWAGLGVAWYLALRWAFLSQGVVLEGWPPSQALSRSSALTRGYKGRLLVLGLVCGGCTWGMYAVAEGLWTGAGKVATDLVGPLYGVSFTLLYLEVRARKEGDGAQELAQALAGPEGGAGCTT